MPTDLKRIVVTGSSGYLGRRLIRYIQAIEPGVKILGLDVVASRESNPHEFVEVDVRRPAVRSTIEAFQPDTVVHLAFVVNPLHDELLMHDINVNGSRNLFDVVSKISVKRLLVASSATAYGAWPDNPVPIEDRAPIRGPTRILIFVLQDGSRTINWRV